jgi:hypothetical protein
MSVSDSALLSPGETPNCDSKGMKFTVKAASGSAMANSPVQSGKDKA